MQNLLSFDEAIAHIQDALPRLHSKLIAIDGLPCSGKSTLATKLEEKLGLECIYLDDFVLPENEWPKNIAPAFPFQFIRYNEFMKTITTLATTGICSYRLFDWQSMSTSNNVRTVNLDKPVIIEGASALNSYLCQYYGLKIFIESDRAITLKAATARGLGNWEQAWQNIFLPSVDIYIKTNPQKRADLIVAGRGI